MVLVTILLPINLYTPPTMNIPNLILPPRLSPEFPTALRELRERTTLNFSELARLVEVSSSMINRYEQGVSSPRPSTYLKLNEVIYEHLDENVRAALTQPSETSLTTASIEELCAELKRRGVTTITLTF